MPKSLIVLSLIPTAILAIVVLAQPTPQTPNTQHPTPQIVNTYLSLSDLNRLKQIKNLLATPGDNYQEYLNLCSQSTYEPKLGMTFDQARASTWCVPYSRNKTTNVYGEFVQEVYLKNPNAPAKYSDRKYLYFQNGILVSIQE